jgi:hypothetical protein
LETSSAASTSWPSAGNYQSTDGIFGGATLEAKMLPTVENEKPKLQEPAIPVIIWVYISYVFPNLSSFRFRQPSADNKHSCWIVLSSVAILFNKYLLDDLAFRKQTSHLSHLNQEKLTIFRLPYVLTCSIFKMEN